MKLLIKTTFVGLLFLLTPQDATAQRDIIFNEQGIANIMTIIPAESTRSFSMSANSFRSASLALFGQQGLKVEVTQGNRRIYIGNVPRRPLALTATRRGERFVITFRNSRAIALLAGLSVVVAQEHEEI